MKRCQRCNVNISTPTDVCPLCGAPLSEGSDGESWFQAPAAYPRWRHVSVWGVYIICWICLTALFIGLERVLTPHVPWAAVASVSIFSVFVVARFVVKDRSHPASKIFTVTALLTLLIITIQPLTRQVSWAYNFAIPVLLSLGAVMLGTLAVSGRNGAAAYGMYLLAVAVCGLLPIGLNELFGEPVLLPSVICATICGTVLIMILTTQFGRIKSELARRFHL